MKQPLLASFVAISLVVSPSILAGNIKITGSIPLTVKTEPVASRSLSATTSAPVIKKVKLERVALSASAKKHLASAANQAVKRLMSVSAAASPLPPSVQLAMNGVPVLDQGQHGTCVTFASSAAVDAAYGKTRYISELCNLSLGSYLENEAAKNGGEFPAGWDGSLNFFVLGQMQKYGVISMDYQKHYGCGSTVKLTEYPANDESNHGSPMSDVEFTKHSQYILKDIAVKMLLNPEDAFTPKVNMDSVLENVKSAITKGHRVVFGVLLDVNGSLGYVNGADGMYNSVKHDAWILTKQIRNDAAAEKIDAAHAMVITGYDDNAEITASDGSKHRGVLTLRNSWADSGYQGDYYMSYEYFKLLAMEAEEIG